MIGFDDKALVVYPKVDIYETKNIQYRSQFQIATNHLLEFLRAKFYTPHLLITDDMAKALPQMDIKWVATLPPGDLFFLSRNCDYCGNLMSVDSIPLPEKIEKAINKKYPITSDLTTEERFDIVCKREKMAAQAIIPEYKVVFYFYKKGYTNYKVTSKPDDGKIRVLIDANTFVPTVYLSGVEQDPIDLLGSNFANRSILNWEV